MAGQRKAIGGRSRLARWLRRLGALLLLLVVAKVAWTLVVVNGDPAADHRSRAAYVVSRVTAPGFPRESVPGVSGVFAGEWRLVTLSMTAMALTNMAMDGAIPRADAERALTRLVAIAETHDVRTFDHDMWNEDAIATLDGAHGHIGYLGHYLLILDAQRAVGGDASHDALRTAIADALARRLDASPVAHAETYPGETYTADNAVVAAALALSDLVSLAPSHAATLARYARLSRTLRGARGGIAFSIGTSPRGSALGWSSFYLPYADRTLAREEWRTLRGHYVADTPLGLAAVREVEEGEIFAGDVDSGPVVLGLSPSGTGFAIGGARHQHDTALASHLRSTAELVGTTLPWGAGRHYALSPLVGDAILLAMDTARSWDARYVR